MESDGINDNGNSDGDNDGIATASGDGSSDSGLSARAQRINNAARDARDRDADRSVRSDSSTVSGATDSDGTDSGIGGESSRGSSRDSNDSGLRIESGRSGTGGSGFARGRHKRECTCARCEERRSAKLALPVGDEPKRVTMDQLSGAKLGNAKEIESEAISIFLDVVYESPKYFLPAGTADHMPLDSVEKKEMGKRISDVIKMLPKRKRTSTVKFLEKVMPPLALAYTTYMITAPRVALTRQLIAESKTRESHAPRQSSGNTGGSSNGASGDVTDNVTSAPDGIYDANGSANGRAIRDPFASSPPFGFGVA